MWIIAYNDMEGRTRARSRMNYPTKGEAKRDCWLLNLNSTMTFYVTDAERRDIIWPF